MNVKLLIAVALLMPVLGFGQSIEKIINAKEVERIERILAADDMQGRKPYTAGIDKAADFIAAEFAKSKLQFLSNSNSYFQEFSMIRAKPISISGTLDGEQLNSSNIAAVTSAPHLEMHSFKGYDIVVINKEDDFSGTVFPLMEEDKNLLILVDTAHTKRFKGMQRFAASPKFASPLTKLFILTTNLTPTNIDLHLSNQLTEQKLKNVVGVLPGKKHKDAYVIFSAHYDHLGIGKPNEAMDSIYNGANDDAAGTTAVILLAEYFSKMKNNQRTLLFVAFTAEESGGYGSRYFSKQLIPDSVVAMFNIEMIGTESKWGTNSAFITGFDKSDMGKILQKNLSGSKFRFEPDPYPKENLFYRSDNATLAALGVPAHTISTAKMDKEKFYHSADDEIETLDMNNMAEIIQSIAISSTSIVNGKDTPTRVAKEKR